MKVDQRSEEQVDPGTVTVVVAFLATVNAVIQAYLNAKLISEFTEKGAKPKSMKWSSNGTLEVEFDTSSSIREFLKTQTWDIYELSTDIALLKAKHAEGSPIPVTFTWTLSESSST